MKYVHQDTRFTDRRSVTETILETLTQSGVRPPFSAPKESRRARFGQIAGAFAMLLGLGALGFLRPMIDSSPTAGDPVAFLEVSRGSVGLLAESRSGSSRLLTLAAGEPIHAGTVIETGASSTGRAAFRLAGGPSMRLDTGSRVRFASSSQVGLERGAVYVDSAAGASVEVRTALGVVRDIGTQFEVRLSGGSDADAPLRVRVREGSVILEHDGESHHAAAGEELSMQEDGTLKRGTSPIYGPDWDWVLDAATAPDIAGQPLQVFLDWASREGGWTVRFADEETAELASTTLLHGDIRELTLDEASSMVMSGSGLGYRLEDGKLFVGPADAEVTRR